MNPYRNEQAALAVDLLKRGNILGTALKTDLVVLLPVLVPKVVIFMSSQTKLLWLTISAGAHSVQHRALICSMSPTVVCQTLLTTGLLLE